MTTWVAPEAAEASEPFDRGTAAATTAIGVVRVGESKESMESESRESRGSRKSLRASFVRYGQFATGLAAPQHRRCARRAPGNAARASSAETLRHLPGARSPSSRPPNAMRFNRVTSCPADFIILRISRFLPSVSSTMMCVSRFERFRTSMVAALSVSSRSMTPLRALAPSRPSLAAHGRHITPDDAGCRIGQPVGKLRIVGEQQQTRSMRSRGGRPVRRASRCPPETRIPLFVLRDRGVLVTTLLGLLRAMSVHWARFARRRRRFESDRVRDATGECEIDDDAPV